MLISYIDICWNFKHTNKQLWSVWNRWRYKELLANTKGFMAWPPHTGAGPRARILQALTLIDHFPLPYKSRGLRGEGEGRSHILRLWSSASFVPIKLIRLLFVEIKFGRIFYKFRNTVNTIIKIELNSWINIL